MADDDLSMEFVARRLKILRGNLTQSEAAARAGVTQAVWDRYEHGARMPRANVVGRICKGFGVTPNWFYGLSDENEALAQMTARAVRAENELDTLRNKILALVIP